MTQFRRRKDNGRVFPIKNGCSPEAMNDFAKQDINRVKEAAAKQTKDAGNTLAISKQGDVKKDSNPTGDQLHKQEAKAILNNEAKMVKEIVKIEHKAHPTDKEFKNLGADVHNLKVVHPELADRVLED